MTEVTKILGKQVGVQFQGTQDKTSFPNNSSQSNILMLVEGVGRGRLDGVTHVQHDTFKARLGYERDNLEIQAVEDVLNTGVPSVMVMRCFTDKDRITVSNPPAPSNEEDDPAPVHGSYGGHLADFYIDDVLVANNVSYDTLYESGYQHSKFSVTWDSQKRKFIFNIHGDVEKIKVTESHTARVDFVSTIDSLTFEVDDDVLSFEYSVEIGNKFKITNLAVFDDGISSANNQWALVLDVDNRKEILHLDSSNMVYLSNIIGKSQNLGSYLLSKNLSVSAPNIPSSNYNTTIYENMGSGRAKFLFVKLSNGQMNMSVTRSNPTENESVGSALSQVTHVDSGYEGCISFILSSRGVVDSVLLREYLRCSREAKLTLQTGRHSIKTSNGYQATGTIDELRVGLGDYGIRIVVDESNNTMTFVNDRNSHVLVELSAEDGEGVDYVAIKQENSAIALQGKTAQFVLQTI